MKILLSLAMSVLLFIPSAWAYSSVPGIESSLAEGNTDNGYVINIPGMGKFYTSLFFDSETPANTSPPPQVSGGGGGNGSGGENGSSGGSEENKSNNTKENTGGSASNSESVSTNNYIKTPPPSIPPTAPLTLEDATSKNPVEIAKESTPEKPPDDNNKLHASPPLLSPNNTPEQSPKLPNVNNPPQTKNPSIPKDTIPIQRITHKVTNPERTHTTSHHPPNNSASAQQVLKEEFHGSALTNYYTSCLFFPNFNTQNWIPLAIAINILFLLLLSRTIIFFNLYHHVNHKKHNKKYRHF